MISGSAYHTTPHSRSGDSQAQGQHQGRRVIKPTKPRQLQRPHVCKTCQRAFVRAEHLQRHVASHENRRPYVCKTCTSSFGRADALLRHERKCTEASNRQLEDRENLQPEHDEYEAAEESSHQSPVSEELTMANSMTTLSAAAHFLDTESFELITARSRSEQRPGPMKQTDTRLSRRSISTQSEDSNTDIPVCTATSIQGGILSFHPVLSNQGQLSFQDYTSNLTRIAATSVPTPSSLDQMQFVESDSAHLPATTFGDISTFNTNDLSFLEDFLLPDSLDVHATKLSLELPTYVLSDQANLPDNTELLSGGTQQASPRSSPDIPMELPSERPIMFQKFHGLQCREEDAAAVQSAFIEASKLGAIIEPKGLTRSCVSRLFNAYFEYFDPHTPIVHRPTFSITSTPSPLLLAMLSIGGCYLSEHELACRAYEAACWLISQHECNLLQESTAGLWLIQATVLCIQFGEFADNKRYNRQAQRHLALVGDLLRAAEVDPPVQKVSLLSDWQQWLRSETLTRLACWTCVLSGVALIIDPQATSIVAHQEFSQLLLPSGDDVWRAGSATAWLSSLRASPSAPSRIYDVFRMMTRGEKPKMHISSFGMLSLIGAILSYVCSHERHSMTGADPLSGDVSLSIERSLEIWKVLWRQHPHVEGVPSKYGDPLRADSLTLLGSAYFHLYMAPELRVLKRIAQDPQSIIPLPPLRPRQEILKAIKYAANSWLVRAKLGIAHLQRTAALEFGGHALITAYESALMLSWWLNISLDPAQSSLSDDAEYTKTLGVLDKLFRQVFEEIGYQGVCCDFSKTHPASTPLAFYRMLMQRWVWTYASSMAKNLTNFASRIQLQCSEPGVQ